MKKAQIEIVGLFVIIILLTIALLISLRFLLRPESTNILESGQQIKANSIMNSILSTNTDFIPNSNKKLRDKISDCIQDDDCEDPPPTGGNSVKDELTDILNQFLKNKKYHLIIENDYGASIIIDQYPDCNENTIPRLPVRDIVKPAAPRITYMLILCNPNFQ